MQTVTNSQTRRFERPIHNRLVAGVAAGVADYFSVSLVAVRVAFIALAVLGGAAVPLYLLGWLLMPSSGVTRSPAERFLARIDTRTKQTLAIVVGFLLLAAIVGYSPLILLIALVLGVISYRILEN